MKLITNLRLTEFKCFQNQRFPLRALSLLAGANASGKSSMLQALLLLRQSVIDYRVHPLRSLLLAGDLFDAGTAKDIVNAASGDRRLYIGLQSSNGSLDLVFTYPPGRSDIRAMPLAGEEETDELGGSKEQVPLRPLFDFALFRRRNFAYLSAERLGPRAVYPTAPEPAINTGGLVGTKGEYTAHVLASKGLQPIFNLYWRNEASGARQDSHSLLALTRYWLATIIPGADVRASTSFERVEYAYFDVKVQGQPTDYLRPTHTGFGISYALPIIVAGLALPRDSLLLIENPEAHLHPRGQSAIGRFLAHVAASGVQVITETHSDHVLNGIRLAIRGRILSPEDTSILYFDRNNSTGAIRVEPIEIGATGEMDQWPVGFFDQSEKDLGRLLGFVE